MRDDSLKYSGQESGQEIRSPGPMVYNGKATTRYSQPIRLLHQSDGSTRCSTRCFEWPIIARLWPHFPSQYFQVRGIIGITAFDGKNVSVSTTVLLMTK